MRAKLQNGANRRGLTLVELLVVILIILLVSAVTLPTIVSSFNHRQVSEAARILQGGLVGARDVAINTNAPAGIRLLPDPAFTGINPANGRIDGTQILAANRFVPLQIAPDYSEGRVSVLPTGSAFTVDPTTFFWFPGSNKRFSYPFGGGALLFVGEQSYDPLPPHLLNPPTSWYWNIRVGDKIQLNNSGNWYTIVGPMNVENPEGFVNVGPPGTVCPSVQILNGNQYPREVLFLVNGLDDNHDGYVDNGFDGIDNDGDGLIDQPGPPYNTVNALNEWVEGEVWHAAFENRPSGVSDNLPYVIARRPVVAPGARETLLPGGVVVDMTHIPGQTMERSRLPVDPMSGAVDILLNPSGQVVSNTAYSSPTSFGMDSAFYHFWLAERGDLYPNGLIQKLPFRLPMPYGTAASTYDSTGTATVTPNYYDTLVVNNPTLPVLKGEIRILTLFTRTGQLVTTDNPVFDVNNVNHPFLAAQRGARGQ